MNRDGAAPESGALNLLHGCAHARAGESLIILEEDAAEGYYGSGLGSAIAAVAARAGLSVSRLPVPFRADVDTLDDAQLAAVTGHDHALFLARLGDQLRFKAMPAGARPIVSYVLDEAGLASGFGAAPYGAFVALKKALDSLFARARQVRVTCPLGTDFAGAVPPSTAEEPSDVTIKRFPMSVFAPLPAAGFTGRVAVAHLICGTGSRYYEPFGFPLAGTLMAEIAGGRLARWRGPAAEVARVEAHYAMVAARYGIDGSFVHSWHAGIHPGCAYVGSAHANYARWSGSAFGNPRLLHFHTCGAYAPGEICWNVVDPTIEADGVVIWQDGRIRPEAIPGAEAILAAHPAVAELFARPEQAIGLGEAGHG